MAYTTIITKVSVTNAGRTYRISCAINDGVDDVFQKEYSATRNLFNPLVNTLNNIREQFKVDWDDYKANEDAFNDAGLDAAIETLQTQANNYINE